MIICMIEEIETITLSKYELSTKLRKKQIRSSYVREKFVIRWNNKNKN
jgi:hypothetical protein